MRSCRRKECDLDLPEGVHASKRYCSDECMKLSRQKNQRDANDLWEQKSHPTWDFFNATRTLKTAWVKT
jgi:hypothetical protein